MPGLSKKPDLTQSNSWPYLLSLSTLFALRLYESTRRHFERHCNVERPVRPALCSKWRTLADKTGQKPTQCGTGIARPRVSVTIYERSGRALFSLASIATLRDMTGVVNRS
jgi:hypothetical protein